MKQRILVTGGAGFIGSHLVDALLSRGHEVLVLDDLSFGFRRFVNPRAGFKKCDIRSAKAAKIIRDWKPEVIFHLAAQTSVPMSFADPANDADINVKGTLNLLEAARQAGCGRFVFMSSGGLLSSEETVIPTDEEHIIRPDIPYCLSKAAAEECVFAYQKAHGMSVAVLRPANVYGPRQNPYGPSGVVAIFMDRMLKNHPLRMDGDGRQTADYVYVSDIVKALLLMIERPQAAGPYHLGSGKEVSVNELFARTSKLTGYRLAAVQAPARTGEARRRALDSAKINREMGWAPEVTLDEGLELTLNWFVKEQGRCFGESLKSAFSVVATVIPRLRAVSS
jgi:UDP-glucose 4-epimerase